MLEGVKYWRSDEFVKVLIVDFIPLKVSHLVALKGENKLTLCVLTEYCLTFKEESTGSAVAKVLHSDARI